MLDLASRGRAASRPQWPQLLLSRPHERAALPPALHRLSRLVESVLARANMGVHISHLMSLLRDPIYCLDHQFLGKGA